MYCTKQYVLTLVVLSKIVEDSGYILSTIDISQQRPMISDTTVHQMWGTISAQHL